MRVNFYQQLIANVFSAGDVFERLGFDDRFSIAKEIGEKKYPIWDDFLILNECLKSETGRAFQPSGVLVNVTWAIAEVVNKLTPNPKLEWKLPWRSGTEKYSTSSLMAVALDKETCVRRSYALRHRPEITYTSSLGSLSARINSAIALRTIVEKIGDQLSDEAEIIKRLINANVKEIRIVGAEAARNTSDHKWIQHIEETGLISALCENRDLDEKEILVCAIAVATENLLKKGFPVNFLGNNHLRDSLISLVKNGNVYTRTNSSFLLANICSLSPDFHSSVENLFIDIAENDSEQRVKQCALGGIGWILEKRQISNHRLPSILVQIAGNDSSSNKVKQNTLECIGNYLLRSSNNFTQFDDVIIKAIGQEQTREQSLYALAARLKKGVIDDQRLLPLLMTSLNDEKNISIKLNAFLCLSNYLKWKDIDNPDLLPVIRKNFNNFDDKIRSSSLEAFGRKLLHEAKLELESSDIPALLAVAENDLYESAKYAATFSLATVIVKEPGKVQESEIQDRIENLCRQYKHAPNTPKVFSETMNYALIVLEANLQTRKTLLKGTVTGEPLNVAEGLFKRDSLQTQTIDSLSSYRYSLEVAIDDANKKIDDLQKENRLLAYQLQQEQLIRKELETKVEKLANELQTILRSDNASPAVKQAASQLVLGVFEHVLNYKGVDPAQLIKDVVIKTGLYITVKPFIPKVIGISYKLLGLLFVL